MGINGIEFSGTIPAQWNQHLVLKDVEAFELFQQITEIRKNKKLKILTASALYTSGGVNFCSVLNLKNLAVNSAGDLIFCCDTIENGAIIGSLNDNPLANLIQMFLEQSAKLQSQRAEWIANGTMGEGFDTCAFCNQYFDEQIHQSVQL